MRCLDMNLNVRKRSEEDIQKVCLYKSEDWAWEGRLATGEAGYMSKSGVRRCQVMSVDVRRCQEMSGDVRRCQEMSGYVRRCQEMSRNKAWQKRMAKGMSHEILRYVTRCHEM